MTRQRSVFDIIGPVMIGPSSSHTAGAVRLGKLARAVFGAQPRSAKVLLHGSFASTGRGHGTDLALVAGLLDMSPDDPRIPDSLALANASGLVVSFESADLGEVHPNTAQLTLDADGRHMTLRGSSLGGGHVEITDVDGFEVAISGELPMLVVEHQDQPGEIAAVTTLLADSGVNIASMRVSREQRGARALMLIETDAEVADEVADIIASQPGTITVRRVPAL